MDGAIAAIGQHVAAGTARGNTDDRTRDAVLWQLVVIGEAIKGLSTPARGRDRHDLLRKFAGLRDMLTHEYFRVDLAMVETILDQRLPLLQELIEELRQSD